MSISKQDNTIVVRSQDAGFQRTLAIPDGISIAAVHPVNAAEPELPRHIFLYPGGTPPRIGIELVNRRNDRRLVRIDPTTGVPNVERLAAGQEVK